MTWVPVIFLALAMGVVAVGTSYFWLRLARVPASIAAVLAPAVTVVVTIALGIIYANLGIFWSGARVIPVLAVIGLLGFGFFLRWGSPTPGRRLGKWFWVLLIAGWVLAAAPMVASAPANNPIQQWDPSFHMNGLWSINRTGDGSWGTALAPNYGGQPQPEYPAAWHIFTSLFSTTTTIVQSANASTLALMLLWVAGAAVYTRTLFRSKAAWTVAPLLAGGMMGMPADGLGAYAQWPNAASVALLPGVASFAVLLGRRFYRVWAESNHGDVPRLLISVFVLLLGTGGMVAAHPSGAFAIAFMLAPALLGGLLRLSALDWRRSRYYALGIWALVAVGMVEAIWVALNTGAVRSMGRYPRSGVSWNLAFSKFLTPTPPFGQSLSIVAWTTVVAALMALGAVVIVVSRLRHSSKFLPLWPILSFLVFAGLVFLAYSPNSDIRTFFTAPWYLDARRIMQPQNLTMVPLAALGFGSFIRYFQEGVARGRTAVAAACVALFLVLSAGGGYGARLGAFQSVYDGDKLGKPGMATEAELGMLRQLDTVLPPGAVVLGDPQNGAVYAEAIGNREAVFPQLTYWSSMGESRQYLRDHFKEINVNPRVCEAVRDLGVTHFYEDADGTYYSKLRSSRSPGLYNVDTSTGFEEVARGGEAAVYRITACD